LCAALERLNAGRMGHHALPPEVITAAVDELTRDRSAMSLEAANREVYRLLKEGIPVSVMDAESTPHPGPRTSGRESAQTSSQRNQSRLTSAATFQKGRTEHSPRPGD
jgi:type I restriction enzyme R subunit